MSDFTMNLRNIENMKNDRERIEVSNFYVTNYLRENDCCISSEDWKTILFYDYDPWCLIYEVVEHWTPEKERKIAKLWWSEFEKINTDDYGQITESFMFWPEGTDQFDIMEAFKDFFDIDVITDKDFMGMVGFANGDYLVEALKRKQEENKMVATPMTNCGRYMNVWNDMGEYDCFIIFHEAEDNDKIDKAIEETENICHHIMQNKYMKTEAKRKLIDDLLDTYTEFGVGVIIVTDKAKERSDN